MPAAISTKHGNQFLREGFGGHGFAGMNIQANLFATFFLLHNDRILVGVNGLGKSTVLTMLYYIMSQQPHTPVTPQDISHAEYIISANEAKTWIRGKYEFFFFVLFCQALARQLNKPVPDYQNVIELVSSRISTPSDLRIFFDKNFNKIVALSSNTRSRFSQKCKRIWEDLNNLWGKFWNTR